jgi:hypothetical protein
VGDISKCSDSTCPSAEKCWRFRTPTAAWQTWGDFDRHGKDQCDYFVALLVADWIDNDE